MFVGCGAKDEQRDRDERRADQCADEAIFWSRSAGVADLAELLLNEWGGDECEACTDEDGDEHESDLSIIVTIQFRENNRIREEESV